MTSSDRISKAQARRFYAIAINEGNYTPTALNNLLSAWSYANAYECPRYRYDLLCLLAADKALARKLAKDFQTIDMFDGTPEGTPRETLDRHMAAHGRYEDYEGDAGAGRSDPASNTRDKALRRLEQDGAADTMRAKYARILYRAARGEIVFDGRRPHALTDKEAASLMECQYTTAGARRNELMGKSNAPPAYQAQPIVELYGERYSYVKDSGKKVSTFRLIPSLFPALSHRASD